MAENQLESSPPEGQELPTPEFSESGDSSTSTGAEDIVSKLLPQLEQIIERKVQSTKDKRISEIEKVLGGRSKILAELESDGVNIPQEVRTKMEIRELREQIAGQSTQPAPAVVDGSTTQKAAVTEAIAELRKYELSENDPAFIELLRGKYKSREEFDLKVKGHIIGKLAPSKPANPADVVQSPAAARPSTVNVDALAAEMQTLSREPSKNFKRIQEIGELLKKAG